MKQQYNQFFESPTDEIMKLVFHCAAVQRFSTIVISSKGKYILWTTTEKSTAINHSDRERKREGVKFIMKESIVYCSVYPRASLIANVS